MHKSTNILTIKHHLKNKYKNIHILINLKFSLFFNFNMKKGFKKLGDYFDFNTQRSSFKDIKSELIGREFYKSLFGSYIITDIKEVPEPNKIFKESKNKLLLENLLISVDYIKLDFNQNPYSTVYKGNNCIYDLEINKP